MLAFSLDQKSCSWLRGSTARLRPLWAGSLAVGLHNGGIYKEGFEGPPIFGSRILHLLVASYHLIPGGQSGHRLTAHG